MRNNWTRIAATLALVSVALPAGALEYGRWNLIDTKTHREFLADAEAPTSLYGTWNLINVSFDHRWLADSLVRTENAGATEKSRKLLSDAVSYSRKFDANGAKVYGADIVSYDNPKTVEEILGRETQKAAGRPVTFIMEKYRINTIKDKHVSRPWSRIDRYDELERHVRNYSTTLEQTNRLIFRDPITNAEVTDYVYVPGAGSAVEDTGYVENGKLLGETVTGTDVLPVTQETFLGATQIREVGRVATGGKAVATASGQAKTFSSNLQVGRAAGKVTYSGVEARVAQGIDKTEVAKTKSKGKEKKEEKVAIKEASLPTPAPLPTLAPVVKPTVAPTLVPVATPKPAVALPATPAPAVASVVKAELAQLDGTNDWKDLGEAIKAAASKDDLIEIGKAILAKKGGSIESSEWGLNETLLKQRVAALGTINDAAKFQFIMDSFDVASDILSGADSSDMKKFLSGKEVDKKSPLQLLQQLGFEINISGSWNLLLAKKTNFSLNLGGKQSMTYSVWY